MRYALLLIVLGALAPACLSMTGCNTVKGVGKDIHDSAQNVQTWIEGSGENRERLTATTNYREVPPDTRHY